MSSIPEILTAKCYFWSPASNAAGRRHNEKRRATEVADFIDANKAALKAAGIEINFSYGETCKNVYKSCSITRNGKRSNITAVKKALGLS